MSHMSKLASGAAYGASAGTVANGLLTRLSPDEWSAVGVIAGIVVALLTFGINWYYKRKTMSDGLPPPGSYQRRTNDGYPVLTEK